MNKQFSKCKIISKIFTKIELAINKINAICFGIRTSIAILNVMNAVCCINIQGDGFASYGK